MDDYDKQERIAIRIDSHMDEQEAIRLTEQEIKEKNEKKSQNSTNAA